jgi:dTMP kinase
MDGVAGKSLRTEWKSALRRGGALVSRNGASGAAKTEPGGTASADWGSSGTPYAGYFLCFEGGDGSGKSTQLSAIADWLRGRGHDVVATREPGGTLLGGKLREIVLDARHAGAVSPRAETLIYAADRADHVERVIRPALERGAVVLTDRYVVSSLAYQGAGRELQQREVELLSRWATQGLKPDATVLLDLDPHTAARRRTGPADRLELESLDFHSRVRDRYLELAAAEPGRYLVVDAAAPASDITGLIKAYLESRVPPSDREKGEQAKHREAAAAEEARLAAERLASQSDEERQAAALEAERLTRVRAEEESRRKTRQEHRERLEKEAQRIEREAGARAREAAAGDLAGNIAQADAAAATPEQIAATARAAAQAQAAAEAAAVEISAPATQDKWEVPNYVDDPELDDSDAAERLSLADELMGIRPRPRPQGSED